MVVTQAGMMSLVESHKAVFWDQFAQNCIIFIAKYFFSGGKPQSPRPQLGGQSPSPNPTLESSQYLSPTVNLTPTPLPTSLSVFKNKLKQYLLLLH